MFSEKLKIMLLAVCNDIISVQWEEIGICYIASYLRQKGYEVTVLQERVENIDYDLIKELNPAVVGLTTYEGNKQDVCETAKKIRNILPETLVCSGGPYSTYCHEELLSECTYIDCVIRGEGEQTFYELVCRINTGNDLRNLKGLTYRDGNKIIINEERELISNLNSIPFPARDILVRNKNKISMISTSRGCLARCSFCADQLLWKKWRGRDAKSIVDEIEYVSKEYGCTLFNFTDASFEDPDKDCTRLTSIANELIRRNLNISYMADFRAEFHKKANKEIMNKLVESGLCAVCIGIESGNESDMKLYNKIATLEDNIKAIELFNAYDIEILPGFINFNPYSTFEGLKKNIEFMEKYEFGDSMEFIVNRYRMFKGAKLYEKIKKDGLLIGTQFSETGYHFVNEKIGEFADFLNTHVDNLNIKVPNALKTINYYVQIFRIMFSQFKKRVTGYNNQAVSVLVQDFFNEYSLLRKEINKTICSWFSELLYLAETEWNVCSANNISDKYLSDLAIKEFAEKFNNLSKRIYFKLFRINNEIAEDFLKIIK